MNINIIEYSPLTRISPSKKSYAVLVTVSNQQIMFLPMPISDLEKVSKDVLSLHKWCMNDSQIFRDEFSSVPIDKNIFINGKEYSMGYFLTSMEVEISYQKSILPSKEKIYSIKVTCNGKSSSIKKLLDVEPERLSFHDIHNLLLRLSKFYKKNLPKVAFVEFGNTKFVVKDLSE
jgi:hypothetical protein